MILQPIADNVVLKIKDRESLIQLVASSMEYANMIVYEKSKEDKELEGMGTTLEVCLIFPEHMLKMPTPMCNCHCTFMQHCFLRSHFDI